MLTFHRLRYKLPFIKAAKDLGAWEDIQAPVRATKAASSKPRVDPVKAAARRFAYPALRAGFKPEALYEYRDAHGRALYWVIRANDPKTGAKWIRPMHCTNGRFELGKPTFEHGKPLYGLDLMAAFSTEVVLVCEGEKCADALRKRGLLAITSGSATTARNADWNPVAGRQILIWPDHDEAGYHYAKEVADRVAKLGCTVSVIDTARLGLGAGEDAVDWLKLNSTAGVEEILALATITLAPGACLPEAGESAIEAQQSIEAAVISRWCSERCLPDERAWSSLSALYRNFSTWCEPDYAFGPGEFMDELAQMGIQVGGQFVKGVVLAEDAASFQVL